MAMNNSKVPSFGKSDKQIADAFGMSASDFKKVKKQIISDMTKTKPIGTAKPKPAVRITKNEKMIAEQLSPKGMKKAAKNQSDALDKKYPGLYKKKK